MRDINFPDIFELRQYYLNSSKSHAKNVISSRRFQGILIILTELRDISKICVLRVAKICQKNEPGNVEIWGTNRKYWILSIFELREPILKILGNLKSWRSPLSIQINEVWIARNSQNPLLSLMKPRFVSSGSGVSPERPPVRDCI